MGNILYNIGVWFMGVGVRLASLFNRKARLWVLGRKDLFGRLGEAVRPGDRVAWFHAASLGEFEQGRPVIEAFRRKYPEFKVLLTFFSPSGYEVRKNYSGADWIFYLPADIPGNARRFVGAVKPEIAVFIKYEFWRNYLKVLKRNGTRTFIVSAIFRRNSSFFNKWYGGWYREVLGCFEHIFVQDKLSRRLLGAVGVKNVIKAGDTRFDRVYEIVAQAKEQSVVAAFAGGQDLFVAGSTWPEDEELLVRLIEEFPGKKFLIAPHEIHPERIELLAARLPVKCALYTRCGEDDDFSDTNVMFVDTIGILSSVYRYGKYAYIGGGFGVGIHNILEAATFGLPIAFGPNYHKFKEANDLVAVGGAVSVNNYGQLKEWFRLVSEDRGEYEMASGRCRGYVERGRGATRKIMEYI